MIELDHLVYGVPDLLEGVRQFAAAAGIELILGGRHVGLGTANYLVGLGAGAYLEIIGPDPDATGTPPSYAFGVDTLRQPTLLTWSVRRPNLDEAITAARGRGYDPGDAVEMARRAGSGELLQWRLTPNTIDSTGGTVPFLIDWGQSTHPTVHPLPRLNLTQLALRSPDPERISSHLTALGIAMAVEYAERAAVRATLGTPNGTVSLT